MRIKSLSIQDFRGFRRFEMNDLGRINLIVGTNNSGKTTVLEALNILMAHGNPAPLWTTLDRRREVIWVEHDESGTVTSKHYEVRQLFRGYGIEVGKHFQLSANTDIGCVKMIADVSDKYPVSNSQVIQDQLLRAAIPEDLVPPLTLSLSWSNNGSQEIDFPVSQRGIIAATVIAMATRGAMGNGRPPRFVSSSALTAEAAVSFFGEIVLTPEEDMVVDALRIIEPSIERIASAGSDRISSGLALPQRAGIFVRLKDAKDRIPIGSMGDGIWRILGLALNIVHSRDGILLIDEIDTGLHYTVMEDMWKFLDSATKTYNVQVFATTHSRDCYESLAAIAHSSVSENSDVTIQRIERGREQAVAYSEQAIVAAAKHGYEVR